MPIFASATSPVTASNGFTIHAIRNGTKSEHKIFGTASSYPVPTSKFHSYTGTNGQTISTGVTNATNGYSSYYISTGTHRGSTNCNRAQTGYGGKLADTQ